MYNDVCRRPHLPRESTIRRIMSETNIDLSLYGLPSSDSLQESPEGEGEEDDVEAPAPLEEEGCEEEAEVEEDPCPLAVCLLSAYSAIQNRGLEVEAAVKPLPQGAPEEQVKVNDQASRLARPSMSLVA